jgi:hypothetical protein
MWAIETEGSRSSHQANENNSMLFDTIKNNNTMNTNKIVSVPSRVHIFLWSLANNKTLTRDNPEKRKKLDDNRCLFYLLKKDGQGQFVKEEKMSKEGAQLQGAPNLTGT